MSAFDAALGAIAVIAGGIAAVAGFGIGSLLTPLLAWRVGTKTAVAAVSIPHLAATALRFWRLRRSVDRRLLWTFGFTSAAGGLTGALLNARASSPSLAVVFGVLLILAGTSELTGLMRRLRPGSTAGWIAGALSGVLGGLVGNQGGIRSAAMLGFDVARDAYVATATAAALFVDAARMPVYFVVERDAILALAPQISLATAGTVIGTLVGTRVLRRIPEQIFRRTVAVLLLALGATVLLRTL